MQDVTAEYEIARRLDQFTVPDKEEELWQMDVQMNAFGVKVDPDLIAGALYINDVSVEHLTREAKRLTGLSNPNSIPQLKQWFYENYRIQVDSLDKESIGKIEEELSLTVQEGLAHPEEAAVGLQVLDIRRKLGKTSISKYTAMVKAGRKDPRADAVLRGKPYRQMGRAAGADAEPSQEPPAYPGRRQKPGKSKEL